MHLCLTNSVRAFREPPRLIFFLEGSSKENIACSRRRPIATSQRQSRSTYSQAKYGTAFFFTPFKTKYFLDGYIQTMGTGCLVGDNA
jgi:hypothetical protein